MAETGVTIRAVGWTSSKVGDSPRPMLGQVRTFALTIVTSNALGPELLSKHRYNGQPKHGANLLCEKDASVLS